MPMQTKTEIHTIVPAERMSYDQSAVQSQGEKDCGYNDGDVCNHDQGDSSRIGRVEIWRNSRRRRYERSIIRDIHVTKMSANDSLASSLYCWNFASGYKNDKGDGEAIRTHDKLCSGKKEEEEGRFSDSSEWETTILYMAYIYLVFIVEPKIYN